jgi:hypothetical protein
MNPYCREISKREWIINSAQPTHQEIQTGAVQRIADAVEKMAGSYASLISDRNYYKDMYEAEQKESRRLRASRNSLRGALTVAKRKAVKP